MARGKASHASSTRGTAIAVVAAALILLVPAIAAASQCSRSERVDREDAECLSASWRNRGIFKKSTYRVRNMCTAYGRVAAKVDLVAARDRTVNLDDGRPRRGWAWRQIRSISCCSDIGICNRSDAVTDEGCLARFKQASSAPLSCGAISATAAISGENYSCTITARCHRNVWPPTHLRYFHDYRSVPCSGRRAQLQWHPESGALQRRSNRYDQSVGARRV